MLDVAVVGAGLRGETHLDTISRLTDLYRLVGVCDAREERRRWAAETYGVPTFEEPISLLERASPQVVAVVVPPDAHHVITAAAAARGCHVLSETPIATTRAMADHMIESCRRAGVVLEVAENVWRFPAERLKRLAVEAGLIGDVQQVHLWYRSGSYHGTNALRRFITTPPRRALGVSRALPVAAYRDLMGNELRRQTWELGVLEFENAVAVYQLPVGSDRGNLWEVVGSEGALMGTELLRFDGPNGARRRVPIETITEDAPGGGKAFVAVRLAAQPDRPPLEWENPYRRYGLPGPDDVARADVYAGLHDEISRRGAGGASAGGGAAAQSQGASGSASSGAEWPESPPASARFYDAPNARADQELLMAIRESARRDATWVALPLPPGQPTPFEDQLHEEFARNYGEPPFENPERLLSRLFPRGGLTQTVH